MIRSLSTWVLALILTVLAGASPQRAAAQIGLDISDLVFTFGVSGEGYQGNLPSVTVPVIDTTDRVSAFVGEVGVRTAARRDIGSFGALELRLDAGLRQFAATGFELQDYAPRELVGRFDLGYTQFVGDRSGFVLGTYLQGRQIDDRPPMPLFLQPSFELYGSSVGFVWLFSEQGSVQMSLRGERANYESLDDLPQLNLLDRDSYGAEAVFVIGPTERSVEVHGSFMRSEYSRQQTFDPTDPLRKDRTFQAGAKLNLWVLQNRINLRVGVEGILNRSNSSRPEYDAAKFTTEVHTPFPWGLTTHLYASLTGKSYLEDTPFARLVPGEEADNASVAFLEFERPIAEDLNGAVRLGWTRAEADIGDSYFQRFGASFLFRFRPLDPR